MNADGRWDDWRTPDGTQPDRPTHVVAHLSDTHLTVSGVRYNGTLDSDAALARTLTVLRDALADGRQLDAVLLSGDLTDTGDPDAYRRLAAGIAHLDEPSSGEQPGDGPPPVVGRSIAGAPSQQQMAREPVPIYATGNHDVRREFHRELLQRSDTTEPVTQVHDVAGLRVVVLDSTIPGAGHGRLTQKQLAELTEELATPAPAGSIVMLHHAPIPPPSPLLSYFALERASRQALTRALAGSDVRLVLAGHHHLAQSATLGRIPVAVAGSTVIRTDPLAPTGHDRTWASGTFNLIEVYPDTVVVSVIPVDGAARVFDLDAKGCADVIAAYPADR